MDGGALWAIVHGVAKGQKQLKHTHRDTSRQNPRVVLAILINGAKLLSLQVISLLKSLRNTLRKK